MEKTNNSTGLTLFVTLLVAIIAGHTLNLILKDFLDNLAYRTFGLNPKSTLDTFLYAFVAVLVVVGIIWALYYFRLLSYFENPIEE